MIQFDKDLIFIYTLS